MTIRAGLYGLITADALGVPAESRTREDLRRNPPLPAIFWALIWAWSGFLRNSLRTWN